MMPTRSANCFGLFHIVCGQQQRHAALVAQLANVAPDARPILRIEALGRLVEKEHCGCSHQATRQLKPPLHAAGVGFGLAVEHIAQSSTRAASSSMRWLARPSILPIEPAVKVQHLPAGEIPVDNDLLKCNADAPAHLGSLSYDVVAGHLGRATRGANSVVSIESSVVLPAPFGPNNA